MNTLSSFKNYNRYHPSSHLSAVSNNYSSITKTLKKFPIEHNKACFSGYIALSALALTYLLYEGMKSWTPPSNKKPMDPTYTVKNFSSPFDNIESLHTTYGSEKLIGRLKHLYVSDHQIDEIGKGFFKTVYKLSTKNNALKEVAIAPVSRYTEWTWNEVEVASKVSTGKTSGLIPMGIAEFGTAYALIITKFCNQGALKQNVNKLNTLQQSQALKEIWTGLMTLHSHHLKHGDLKADNILVHEKKNGQLKFYLSDFGTTTKFNTENHVDAAEDIRHFGVFIMADVMGLKWDVLNPRIKDLGNDNPSINEEIKTLFESTVVYKDGHLNDRRAKNLLHQMITDNKKVNPALVSTTLNEIYKDLHTQSLLNNSTHSSKTDQRD